MRYAELLKTPPDLLADEFATCRIGVRQQHPAHWCRGGWQPIAVWAAVWAALQALLAGATLVVRSDGKDRANGHAGRERER
jgi:hypothetical protein